MSGHGITTSINMLKPFGAYAKSESLEGVDDFATRVRKVPKAVV